MIPDLVLSSNKRVLFDFKCSYTVLICCKVRDFLRTQCDSAAVLVRALPDCHARTVVPGPACLLGASRVG